jgi:Holliday junction resolvasome RuvABC DNA-binding subunit
MGNSANTESWVTQNLANMDKTELCKTRGVGNRKKEKVLLQAKASSTVVPKGYYQDTKTQIAKDVSKRVGREKRSVRAGLLV